MLSTVRAVLRNGNMELLEPMNLTDGVQLLVTVLSEGESGFWQGAGSSALACVWDNDDDEIYAELLTA